MQNKIHTDFLEKGFFVYKNFFNKEEADKIIEASNELFKSSDGKGLHNFKNYWNIIKDKKILNTVRELCDDSEIFYLYNSNSKISSKKNNTVLEHNWHRDSACRNFGKGPDWDNNQTYKVVRLGIYLSENTGSGLNVIKSSHRKKSIISWSLILLYRRLQYFSFPPLRILRNFLAKIIGKNIIVNKGDAIFFSANLLHSAIPTEKDRVVMFLAYGPKNMHSSNFVNYYMKHREGWEFKDRKTEQDFIEFAKENNIYFEVSEKKEEIEGVTLSKKINKVL